jgi:serine aminopeptidase S33 family
MRCGMRIVASSVGVVVVAAIASHHRFRPPVLVAVKEAVNEPDPSPDSRLAQIEHVEVEGPEGARLRGLFVHADRDAPIVVHLLESGGSASVEEDRWAGRNPGNVVFELADLGFASLLLDYRGVGSSEGSRRTAHLEEDVHAMWREALRRVNGDGGRLFVRATSIGTVGAMILLRDGVRPAGLALIAPIDAATVAGHFAGAVFGALARGLAAWTLRPVADDVDMPTRLARADAPLFVAAGSEDELWPSNEQAGVRSIVAERRGRFADEHAFRQRIFVLHMDGEDVTSPILHHISLTIHSKEEMTDAERSFWKERGGAIDVAARIARVLDGIAPAVRKNLESNPVERRRLEPVAAAHVGADPRVLAFLARCRAEGPAARTFLGDCRFRSPAFLGDLGEPSWLEVLTFDDPAGDLSGELTLRAFGFFHRGVNSGQLPEPASVATVLEVARGVAADGIACASRKWRGKGPHDSGWWGEDLRSPLWSPLAKDARLTRVDAARHFVRILFHGAGIPDRVTVSTDGTAPLEARDGERWVAIDPSIVFERVATDPPVAAR